MFLGAGQDRGKLSPTAYNSNMKQRFEFHWTWQLCPCSLHPWEHGWWGMVRTWHNTGWLVCDRPILEAGQGLVDKCKKICFVVLTHPVSTVLTHCPALLRPSQWRRSTCGHIEQWRSTTARLHHGQVQRNRRPVKVAVVLGLDSIWMYWNLLCLNWLTLSPWENGSARHCWIARLAGDLCTVEPHWVGPPDLLWQGRWAWQDQCNVEPRDPWLLTIVTWNLDVNSSMFS